MNRRGFLKWVGLAPAAPAVVSAAEKFEATAKALDVEPLLKERIARMPRRETEYDDYDTACSVTLTQIVSSENWIGRR